MLATGQDIVDPDKLRSDQFQIAIDQWTGIKKLERFGGQGRTFLFRGRDTPDLSPTGRCRKSWWRG
jgi:hypothetical protein